MGQSAATETMPDVLRWLKSNGSMVAGNMILSLEIYNVDNWHRLLNAFFIICETIIENDNKSATVNKILSPSSDQCGAIREKPPMHSGWNCIRIEDHMVIDNNQFVRAVFALRTDRIWRERERDRFIAPANPHTTTTQSLCLHSLSAISICQSRNYVAVNLWSFIINWFGRSDEADF